MLHFLYDLTHKLADCPNGFPDKASYVPLTELAALNAKKRQLKMNKPTPTAVVVPTAIIMPSAMLSDGSDSEYIVAPFYTPHFFLDVLISSSTASYQNTVHALIDHGSDSVLIDPILAARLGLTPKKLPKPKEVTMAIGDGEKTFFFDKWVPITIISSDQAWTLRSCRAILAPNLCVPILLGGPFLSFNGFVIDHELQTCVDKKTGYDLLNPPSITWNVTKPRPRFSPELRELQKSVVMDIKNLFPQTCTKLDESAASQPPCPIAAVRTQIETLVTDEVLKRKSELFKQQFLNLFPPDIPDVCELPDEVLMNIKLRDELKPMVACAYSCPKKYREGWKTLIQHLATG